MAHHKRGKRTSGKRVKKKGYIVKGITRRHWWDTYDKDQETSSRGLLKRELSQQLADFRQE